MQCTWNKLSSIPGNHGFKERLGENGAGVFVCVCACCLVLRALSLSSRGTAPVAESRRPKQSPAVGGTRQWSAKRAGCGCAGGESTDAWASETRKARYSRGGGGPSKVPVCARQIYRHNTGHPALFMSHLGYFIISVSRHFTCMMSGNATIEGPPLYCTGKQRMQLPRAPNFGLSVPTPPRACARACPPFVVLVSAGMHDSRFRASPLLVLFGLPFASSFLPLLAQSKSSCTSCRGGRMPQRCISLLNSLFPCSTRSEKVGRYLVPQLTCFVVPDLLSRLHVVQSSLGSRHTWFFV